MENTQHNILALIAKAMVKYKDAVISGDKRLMNYHRGRHDAFVELSNTPTEFLNSESQVDVSASEGESDVLHGVVECNAERENITKTNEEDVEGTLEKIIDCENVLYCKNGKWKDVCNSGNVECPLRNEDMKQS